MKRYLVGTIANFIAGGLALNGVRLSQVQFSTFLPVFDGTVFTRVGKMNHNGGRGRPADILRIDTGLNGLVWSQAEGDGIVANAWSESDTIPVAEAPAEPVAEAPAEPVAEAPAKGKKGKKGKKAEPVAEPVAEAPAEPVAEAPAEPVAEAA